MQLPIPNRVSGTDPEQLLQDYLLVKKKLNEAVDALAGIWPHARDYQHGGDINAAMREHAERCKMLRRVQAEIDVIAESLA